VKTEPAVRPLKLLLVASAGGHLRQLVQLRPVWEHRPRVWVTFPKEDARSLLAGEQVYWAHHPTNRNLPNLLRNLRLAWRLVRQERPDVVITTGAGVGVPFCYVGRLLGAQVIFIETFARVTGRSLTGRLVRPVAHLFLVQWPELLKLYPGSAFHGKVY
jgi:beta-1,4-N-acetylglucosaminyltransferase